MTMPTHLPSPVLRSRGGGGRTTPKEHYSQYQREQKCSDNYEQAWTLTEGPQVISYRVTTSENHNMALFQLLIETKHKHRDSKISSHASGMPCYSRTGTLSTHLPLCCLQIRKISVTRTVKHRLLSLKSDNFSCVHQDRDPPTCRQSTMSIM